MQNLRISGANNYVDILYFLSNSVIHPHIDRIYFSCRRDVDKPEKKLFSVLEKNNYKCKSDKWIERCAYNRIRKYHSSKTGIKVSILYNRISRCTMYPSMGIHIYRPDLSTVNWFDAVCNSLGFLTTLSHIELAIDISPYSNDLEVFFWKHLFLRNHRGGNCLFGDGESMSYYIGNKRKNSKSAIVYPRPKDSIDKGLLRIELRFNRRFINSYEIELDCLEKVTNINLRKLIGFKQINEEKLAKFLLKRRNKELLLPEGRNQYLMLQDKYPFTIEEVMERSSVMEQSHFIKESGYVNNRQRFFDDMDDANKILFEKLKGKRIV